MTKTTKAPKKKTQYEAIITVMGHEYKSKGSTALAALERLEVPVPRGTGVLVVKRGKKQRERVLPSSSLFRLFRASPYVREVQLKSLSALFSDV